jgi:16S rRNA processing protein RimM
MARRDPSHLVVGHLSKPHGIRGELYVQPLTDHPESTFAPGVVLSLGEPDSDEPSDDLPPLRVEAARPFRKGLLVRFGGVDDRNQAELLSGRYLLRRVQDVEPLAEGEVFHHQLLGMTVWTVDGVEVGTVGQIYELEPAELLEVHGSRGSVMIPFRPEIVREVDVEEARLVIDPPEGLLDL